MIKLLGILIFIGLPLTSSADKILIYMDLAQTDHLRAYGITYWALQQGINVEWLLNYRGGSFLMEASPSVKKMAQLRGVAFSTISGAEAAKIYQEIDESNMETILL